MTESKAAWVRAAVREHEGPLVRYTSQITGDVDRARDVVQDAFLRLCSQEPEQLDNHLAEWLFTVCRNRALDLLRKEGRMRTLDEVDLATRASAEPSPAVQAQRNEDASLVSHMLKGLPRNQEEVVRLKFQNGLSYKEISRITHLSVGNVGFLIHTAIKTLRIRMRQEVDGFQP